MLILAEGVRLTKMLLARLWKRGAGRKSRNAKTTKTRIVLYESPRLVFLPAKVFAKERGRWRAELNGQGNHGMALSYLR